MSNPSAWFGNRYQHDRRSPGIGRLSGIYRLREEIEMKEQWRELIKSAAETKTQRLMILGKL